MSADPDWSQVEELGRREEWYRRRTAAMRENRAANSTKSLSRIAVDDDPDNIKARNFDTFWDILRRYGVRFVRARPDHQCEIHKNVLIFETGSTCQSHVLHSRMASTAQVCGS